MNRIEKTFEKLKKDGNKALVSFITAGDPDLDTSEKLLNDLPNYGIDLIELGIPFSDPMADGPTIQRSSQRAIQAGSNLKKTFSIVKRFRTHNNYTPIILMGYFNPIFQFGLREFFVSCSDVGIDGLIIVDLPPEEDKLINSYTTKHNVHNIRLVTPTTHKTRLKKILKHSSGFLYYVSIIGITGTKKPSIANVKNSLKIIKENTKLPILVGFGIDSFDQVQSLNKISDGCVIGSAIIKIIEKNRKLDKTLVSRKVKNFLFKLKNKS